MKKTSSCRSGKKWKLNARASVAVLILMAFVLAAVVLLSNLLPSAKAGNPSNGSVNSTIGSKVTWVGTAVGGASNGESTC